MGPDSFALLAPAKINLGLRILGRRPDGYHEIDTLFQEIDWCDRLEFHASADWSLEVRDAEIAADDTNLVARAASALARAAGVRRAGRIILEKRIPAGGGLGGGSSDAALALLGLSRLWGLNWPSSQLHEVASKIGSDCPFFLYGGLARGRGRGDELTLQAGRAAGTVVLVVPAFGVSTAWAYAERYAALTEDEKSAIFESCLADESLPSGVVGALHNDLETIVLLAHPELGWLKQRLLGLGAKMAMLSGSGSTVFGIFDHSDRALQAAQQFREPDRVRVCRTVARARTF